MADGKGESRAGLIKGAMPPPPCSPSRADCLAETLQGLESTLREEDVSVLTSAIYCARFCEVLMQHSEDPIASENLFHCAEVYGTALRNFASSRPYVTTECEDVMLLLEKLVMSCFEVILSMTEDDFSSDDGLRLKSSILESHDLLVEFGNNNLQFLVNIVKNGGAWKHPVVVKVLTQQQLKPEEAQKWISQEGSCFLQMRIKHLMKSNCTQQAMLLSKLCSESAELSNDFFFRQSFMACLCTLLPNEEAFKEISKMEGKEVLDTICNLESEGQDNTAFILCTTYLTQQLQNETTSCSWELTLFWSKLQRRIDPSINNFLERCRQFGVIAKTRQHLFFLIKVVHTEAGDSGVPVSIILCIRALQIQSNETDATKTSVCKTIACLLPQDLEVRRACQLTEFLFEPTVESLNTLEELFQQPDQKSDEESSVISNSLRCELLLALKGHWVFDPEFWDWKTLKRQCLKLLGKESSDAEEENYEEPSANEPDILNASYCTYEENSEETQTTPKNLTNAFENAKVRKPVGSSERYKRWLQYKFYCVICKREVIEARILHHAKMHLSDGVYTCPVCIKKFKKKDVFVPHVMEHMKMPTRHRPRKKNLDGRVCKSNFPDDEFDANGYLTFKTIQHRNLQDRDVYPCPGTGCSRVFKQFKYLSIHLKGEHSNNDENAKHYLDMKNLREKCAYCRRHFITNFHLKQHKRIHLGSLPFMCVSIDCNERFKSINELLMHKHSHEDLQYQCEMEGCHLVFSDLGLLYHHEAQHFRDASYVCSFVGCKKFYYCYSELQKHLATHGIHFGKSRNETEEFNKIKIEQESPLQSQFHEPVHSAHSTERFCGNSPSLPKRNDVRESRSPSLTQTIYCNSDFQNSIYQNDLLAGSEMCTPRPSLDDSGNDTTKGLQMLRPPQFTSKNAVEATEVLSSFTNRKNQQCSSSDDTENNANTNLDSQTSDGVISTIMTGAIKEEANETLVSGEYRRSASEDTLLELLTSLKHLNLKNSNPCPTKSSPLDHDARASSSKNCTFPNPNSQKQDKILTQYLARLACKPYFCELKGCKYAFVTKDALLLHYVKKHHYTREKALKLNMFQNKYSPFECHICQRSFTRRTHLRIHYKKKHHIGKERVNRTRRSKLAEKKIEQRIINERRTNRLTKYKRNEAGRVMYERRSIQEDFNSEMYLDSFSDETDSFNGVSTSGSFADFEAREGRGSKRTVAQGKLCYILNKYHKPFHCIHKSCNSSFTSQQGLVRHYRLVHQYNKEQLCLEKDKEKSKSEYVKCRRIFTCKYKECRKSFICSKALSKHYRDFHNDTENEEQELDIFCTENHLKHQMDGQKLSEESESDVSEIFCDVDGCSAVFTDHTNYSQHILSRHRKYNLFDGRRKRKKDLGDVQENYIDKRRRSHLLYNRKKVRVKNAMKKEVIEFKTRDEALQMCAQNVDITQFPCMIHGCASVVKLESSIVRHYKLTHNLTPAYIGNHSPELIYCVKNFPRFEKDQSFSPKLSPLKSDCVKGNKIPSFHLQEAIRRSLGQSEQERPRATGDYPLERVSLNFSASGNKQTVCFDGSGIQICKNKDFVSNTSDNETLSSVTNERLDNNLLNWPQHPRDSKLLCSIIKEDQNQPVPEDPVLKNFKPMGFESSFLKFLQESRETDDELEETEWKPPKQCKLQNSFQNKDLQFKDLDRNELHACLPQGKTSRHGNIRGFQPLLSSTVQSSASVPTLQTLRTILDKALTDCGDLALKQLHYQRPVVVLERSKFTMPLIDLFSGKKTDELCVGIS